MDCYGLGLPRSINTYTRHLEHSGMIAERILDDEKARDLMLGSTLLGNGEVPPLMRILTPLSLHFCVHPRYIPFAWLSSVGPRHETQRSVRPQTLSSDTKPGSVHHQRSRSDNPARHTLEKEPKGCKVWRESRKNGGAGNFQRWFQTFRSDSRAHCRQRLRLVSAKPWILNCHRTLISPG